MINETLANDGDRFKTAMRVLRKPGDLLTVIHPPAVDSLEVLADVSSRERRCRPHVVVSCRIRVIVMNAKEERIRGLPRKAERLNVEHDAVLHGAECSRPTAATKAATGVRPAAN